MVQNNNINFNKWSRKVASLLLIPGLIFGGNTNDYSQFVRADDELAKFAAEGNAVGVDGTCFMKKCSLETAKCGNDPTCLKGLSCLARCKGGSMCSTGCFAKYGGDNLDSLLSCSVEKNDCVHVPRESQAGWTNDKLSDLPSKPIERFSSQSLDGTWYKVMGLDSRYDCFECQRNTFKVSKDASMVADQIANGDTGSLLKMEALFRIPRPTAPGYLQSRIEEELKVVDKSSNSNPLATFQSQGQMFGLTFWENWYVIGDSRIQPLAPGQPYSFGVPSAYAQGPASSYAPDMKLIYYTGHTLQGSYKGAFLYNRSPKMGPDSVRVARDLIDRSGLNPNDFCMIKNTCFLNNNKNDNKDDSIKFGSVLKNQQKNKQDDKYAMDSSPIIKDQKTPFWFLGQGFLQSTSNVASELSDWFEDPAILSDWLLEQQERMIIGQPLAVSPFASLPEDE